MSEEIGWELPSPDDGEPPPETVLWVADQLGAAVLDWEALPGGLSSAVHRLAMASPVAKAGGSQRVVLRRHTNRAWMTREPYIPHHEARTLGLLGELDVGVATPTLLAADPDGAVCDVPTIVMTEVPGRPEIDPVDAIDWAERLAECLAGIHRVPISSVSRSSSTSSIPGGLEPCRRWDDPTGPVPTWIVDEQRWRMAQQRVSGPLPDGPTAFLHRDFHPNNVHWESGEICGVVDWLSACTGPVEVDLSHCRWNLAILVSPDLAEYFTDHYQRVTGLGLGGAKQADQMKERLLAYDLSTILSGPVGTFPTHAWNSLGRSDLTPDLVTGRIEGWLQRVLEA